MVEIVVATIGALAAITSTIIARKAERNSRPVSNGAIPGIREDLREVRQLLQRHLEHHAN